MTQADEVRFITLNPGHFHAALVQKEMYPGVSKRVSVYAPLGPDLIAHLNRIAGFNLRKESPTQWELDVHAVPDSLAEMLRGRPGNVVVFAGRNSVKMDWIKASVEAGLNVLADKPWIIATAGMPKLESALNTAEQKGLLAYDIMTERYEITSLLLRELAADPEIFGAILPGTEDDPGVYMESVHHLFKSVAGVPNLRPAWFFDVNEEGEGLPDVGTHLVDLTQWTLFPEQAIDYRTDLKIGMAKRWPTTLTHEQFRIVTGEDFTGEVFDYYCNSLVGYSIRGVQVKLNILWRYDAPPGQGDVYEAVFRGSRSRLEIRQGPDEKHRPELYVVPTGSVGVLPALGTRVEALQQKFPGIAVENMGARLRVSIPDKYRVGHEAHFAQVTRQFLTYLRNPGSLPAWEKSYMLAKYYVTTQGAAAAK